MTATQRAKPGRRGLTTLLLAGGCLLIAVAAIRATVRHIAAQRELAGLTAEVDQIRHGNERLELSLERMKQPAWLALLARDRLNYKRLDETVVFVYKSQKQGTIVPAQAAVEVEPNWRKWFNWLRGVEAGLPAEAP